MRVLIYFTAQTIYGQPAKGNYDITYTKFNMNEILELIATKRSDLIKNSIIIENMMEIKEQQ